MRGILRHYELVPVIITIVKGRDAVY